MWWSFIPVFGNAVDACDSFASGNIWGGLAYSVLAVSDVFLVKALIVGAAKAVGVMAAKELAKEAAACTYKTLLAKGVVAGFHGAQALAQTYLAVDTAVKTYDAWQEGQIGAGGLVLGMLGAGLHAWGAYTSITSMASVLGTQCFVAGTEVRTPDGHRKIEEIKAGDVVWSRDEKTGRMGYKRVVQTYVRNRGTPHNYCDEMSLGSGQGWPRASSGTPSPAGAGVGIGGGRAADQDDKAAWGLGRERRRSGRKKICIGCEKCAEFKQKRGFGGTRPGAARRGWVES